MPREPFGSRGENTNAKLGGICGGEIDVAFTVAEATLRLAGYF